VSLWVDDIEGIIDGTRALGCDVIMPHVSPTEPYGEAGRIQSLFLKDLDGNLVQCHRRL
jgi:hypothetical protein